MIIWDEKKKEHIIRIGKPEDHAVLRSADFQVIGTNQKIETDIKTAIETKTSKNGYHVYVHIFDKGPPVKYVIWCGSVDQEPETVPGLEWWEPEFTEEKVSVIDVKSL